MTAGRLAASRVSPIIRRPYTSQPPPPKEGSNILLFVGKLKKERKRNMGSTWHEFIVGLTAFGGAAHYYYRHSPYFNGTAENKSPAVDYVQVYKDLADLLEDNE